MRYIFGGSKRASLSNLKGIKLSMDGLTPVSLNFSSSRFCV